MEQRSGFAPAKINLTLGVGARRSDGYHEIESLTARVTLRDRLAVAPRADGLLRLTCDDPEIPADETNLALRAARLLAARVAERGTAAAGVCLGADINLEKRIPAGGGLGGGSSDAATTLKLLNDLWKAGLRRQELAELGAALGSDVPLFFHTPVCVLRGRGEIVQDLDVRLDGAILLVLPNIHSSTPAVYRAFDELTANARSEHDRGFSGGCGSGRPSLERVLKAAESCEQLMPLLFNDLEEPAFRVSPALRLAASALVDSIGGTWRLTGSGSAFFRLFDGETKAEACAERVRAAGLGETRVVRFDGGEDDKK